MQTLKKTTVTLSLVLVLGLSALPAGADGMFGQLHARMVIQASCMVSGADAGVMFESQPSTFTGSLTTTSGAGNGAARVLCSPDITSLSVSVSQGDNPGQGTAIGTGARAMRLGSSSYLPYEVYSDDSLTRAYPTASTGVGLVLPATGDPLGLPIYGRVNKTTNNAIPSGAYGDVLKVTLSW